MGRLGIIDPEISMGSDSSNMRTEHQLEMGEIVEFVKFDELEKKISGLIGDYALLKKRNLELEELLQNKIRELEETNKKMGGLREERDAVRTKVDSLLGLLQEIKVA
ncbi:MAG: cell division protein ZapB [Deltaproteobacteria bacterium]|nr:cell division protein ZapB [Deltaproteobacteria bacterium]